MIKELISELLSEKIKLSQALTKAKVIADKIKNDNLKLWLSKELEGYDVNDKYLPKYRLFYSPITLTASFEFGQEKSFPIVLSEKFENEIGHIIHYHEVLTPISTIEEQIKTMKDSKGYIGINNKQLLILSEMYEKFVPNFNGIIKSGHRVVGKVQFQTVIELTKQKILNLLIELNNEFPNLTNEYKMTEENKEKTHNIVTNNIYGNYGSMNIATGDDIRQSIKVKNISLVEEKELRELGVNDEMIDEFKKILSEHSDDKETLKKKCLKWLGTVSAAIAARGLYENIPVITDFIQKYI